MKTMDVFECPIEVLKSLAQAAGVGVTVENFSPVRAADEWFESIQSLIPGGATGRHQVRNATFDVALSNAEFLALTDVWDMHGVYAVFTERSPIAFKASDLDAPARYRALANFGFVLEFALAGPSSDGWSRIVTPRADLADLAAQQLPGFPAYTNR